MSSKNEAHSNVCVHMCVLLSDSASSKPASHRLAEAYICQLADSSATVSPILYPYASHQYQNTS